MDSELDRGIDLFNRGDFYECHDTIEEIWLQESSDRQPLLQGLIQAAVAFHHYEHGKWGAARSMLRLSIDKLEAASPEAAEDLDIHLLLSALREWKTALDQALRQPTRPRFIDLPYPTIQRQG